MSTRPTVAVQMYTVRDHTEKDMAKTLRDIAAMGYEGVELAGYGDLDANGVKRICEEVGLKIVSMHVGIEVLQSALESAVDDALLLDVKFVVVPYIGEEYRTREGIANLGAILTEAGAKLNSAGLQLLYHNHAFEFEKIDGEYLLDLLYSSSDAKLLQIELDTFWAQKGGADVAAYIRKYGERVRLLHVKDMTDDERETFAEVGNGKMPWPEIFAAAEEFGVVAYIVEQDECERDSMESIKISIDNLKKMGKLN